MTLSDITQLDWFSFAGIAVILFMLLGGGIDIALSVWRERKSHDAATFTGEHFDWEP